MTSIGVPWPGDSDVNTISSQVEIPSATGTFGVCSYALYEAYPPGRKFSPEPPLLLVWLHGQSGMHVISAKEVAVMASRFKRRVVCMAPRSPGKCDGKEFFWSLGFNKQQNKNGLGFVYGEINTEVSSALCNAIKQVADEARAEHIVMGGFSMGGLGAFLLGGYRPELFDAIFSIAGHGMGTLLASNLGYKSPQPDGENVFYSFLDTHAPNLAKIPFVLGIHAVKDTVSSYADMEAILDKVRYLGGDAQFETVPEDFANSDSGNTKSKTGDGHGYYKFSILADTSDWSLYGPINAALASERCLAKRRGPPPVHDEEAMAIAAMEAEMAAMQAANLAKLEEEKRKAKIDEEQRRKEEERKSNAWKLAGFATKETTKVPSGKRLKVSTVGIDDGGVSSQRSTQAATQVAAAAGSQSDEVKRQQMRERRKKLIEQNADDAKKAADDAKRQQMRERRQKLAGAEDKANGTQQTETKESRQKQKPAEEENPVEDLVCC